MSEFHVEKREISMLCAERIPAQIDVRSIAEEASQKAFELIHERLTEAGFTASGDIMPDEAAALDRVFDLFVRSAALNNDKVARMNTAGGGIRRGFRVTGVEACCPEALPVVDGIEAVVTGVTGHCPEVQITAETREGLLAYVRTNWGIDDESGDPDWYREYIVDRVEAFGHDRVSVAATAYERVYEGHWGLKASDEDALLGVLRALYPEWYPEGEADGIYRLRGDMALVGVAEWLGENAADLYGDNGVRDIVKALIPRLDSAMRDSLLASARHLGVEVETTSLDQYFIALAEVLWEITLLDEVERGAAVRAVNDGAQVKDRASYADPPRTILMHLNVEVARDDTRTAQEIITAVEGALDVGLDGMPGRDGTRVDVALAEEV